MHRDDLEVADPGSEVAVRSGHPLRGELSDEAYGRERAEEWLDNSVESISFRELQLEDAYFEALKAEIDATLEVFNADSVDEVLSTYLGSSSHVRPGP